MHKNYGAVVALDGASLSIKPGTITALLGSNGSGKSTMVKILAGLVKPDKGELILKEKPVVINSGYDSIEMGIATAFQDLSLIPTMSVMDNILLGIEPTRTSGLVDKNKSIKDVENLLKTFKIKCNPNDYVQNLPPSTQNMIEVAKAVFRKPKVLLLDEVTASLHKEEIEVLFEILRELKEENVAMVYVTHRMNEIFEICDDVTILRSGRTAIDADIDELTIDDIVYHMTGEKPDANREEDLYEVSFENAEVVLDIQHICIFPVVKDISFKAHKGEIVGIGGLEGQGQTEFIRAILGDMEFESDSFVYRGEEIRFKSTAEAIKNDIGFISGERNQESMFAERSIAENLYAGSAVKGKLFSYLSTKKVKRFSNSAVDDFNIKIGKLKDPANSLSGGNQQKVVIARWMAMSPTLLLLDDPTKGVDIMSRNEIHDILRKHAEQGMTIIISASDTEELLEISDRIYVFYEGRIFSELYGDHMNPERLAASMVGMSSKGSQK